MKKTLHPWQQVPSELITYAVEHMHKGGDFNQRIAFLLLDIGVETLLKTFLTLPDEITGVKIPFDKRKESASRGFHNLIKAIKEAAPDKVKNIDLSHIQFYHDIRNNLYHQGNGITISAELVSGYSEISTVLLRELLEIDIISTLKKPEIKAAQKEAQEKLEKEIFRRKEKIQNKILKVKSVVELAIEKIDHELLLPTFVRDLDVSDPVVAYMFILDQHIPDIQDLSHDYSLARLYPQSAQQPDIDFDENDEAVYSYPPIEKVIAEGDRFLANLDNLIMIIDNWTKNAT